MLVPDHWRGRPVKAYSSDPECLRVQEGTARLKSGKIRTRLLVLAPNVSKFETEAIITLVEENSLETECILVRAEIYD